MQYQFAKEMGFRDEKIIHNLLSADTEAFNAPTHQEDRVIGGAFLYVGNFREIKGTDLLAEAFKRYRSEIKGGWSLKCVGIGPLEKVLQNVTGIEVIPYCDQEKLAVIAGSCGAFILPSRRDQWGVVVHEFASFGLPLLLSSGVGARSTFLIEGFNGYSFEKNSVTALSKAMSRMSSLPPDCLVKMGKGSKLLAKRISPEISAASLIAVLEKVKSP
jgi:glycosyltransferase involved in cell wall biosynthesis